MLTYQEFYDLEFDKNKEELSSYINAISKRIALEEFEYDVKEDYEKYKQQQGVVSCGSFISNPKAKDFMQSFLKVSLRNVIPAEMCYYFLTSLVCKKNIMLDPLTRKPITQPYYYIKFKNGNRKKVDSKLHIFWSQESSSGKSKGFEFTSEIADMTSNYLSEKYKLPFDNSLFKIRDIYNTDTYESFITCFANMMDKKGNNVFDFQNVTPGIFEKYDIIKSQEASFLFTKSYSEKSISELMLPALEGHPIPKKLQGWQGHETKTYSNFIFFGCTRPTQDLDIELFEKGLFQRMLLYSKFLSESMRKKMYEESLKSYDIPNSKKESIAMDFTDIYLWRIKLSVNELTIRNEDYYNKRISNLREEHMENIKHRAKKPVVRRILRSLIGRYDSIVNTLFVLNALSNKTTIIEDFMIDECINFIKEIIDSNIDFTDYHIKESKEDRYEHDKMRQMIERFYINKVKAVNKISEKSSITISQVELIELFTKVLKITEKHAEIKVQNFIDDTFLIQLSDASVDGTQYIINRQALMVGNQSIKSLSSRGISNGNDSR